MNNTAQRRPQIVRNRYRPTPSQERQSPATHLVDRAVGPSGLPLLRTSERGTFQRCRFKWYLEFYEQLKPDTDAPPLRFGTLVHSALAEFYLPGIKRGHKPAETFMRLYEADLASTPGYSEAELDEAWAEHADLGVVMLERYYDHYGADDEWEVLVTEWPFQTIVYHPVRQAPWFWYVGILDGVWRNRITGKKVIPDHKTTQSIQFNYLAMDRQATSYWTFGVDAMIEQGLLKPDGSEMLDGMLFNFLRKAKRDERPRDEEGQYRNKPTKKNYIEALGTNGLQLTLQQLKALAEERGIEVLGDESKRQPVPYHARVPIYRDWYERESARRMVQAEFEDMERVGRDARNTRKIPPTAYKNGGQFTCPSCWAFDICELHEIGGDWVEMKDMTTHEWSPYSEHEIREGR